MGEQRRRRAKKYVDMSFQQDVDPDDPATVVEVVTHSVLVHSACWQVKKAESLAVFAVQFALWVDL